MATVRELIVKLIYHVDDSGIRKAEKAETDFLKKAKEAGAQGQKSMDRVTTAANKAGSAGLKATTAMGRLRMGLMNINSRNLTHVGSAAQSAAQSLDRVTTAANKAGSATAKAGTVAGTTWRQLAGTIAASVAGVNIIDTANETMDLDNRLKTIEQDNKKRAALKKSLYDIGQESRSDYLGIGDLFFKVQRAGSRFGFTQKDSLDIAEIVSKALTTGGASTAEKNATILQLGQALSSGTLQGDELRSLDENAGYLMQYVAESMGVNIGDLKQMGAKGELTTEKVVKAILSAGKKVREDFELSTQTIGQSWERVKNAFKYAIDTIESETHIFSRIANGISTALDIATRGATDIKKIWNGDSKTTRENPLLASFVLGTKKAYKQAQKVYKTLKKNLSTLQVKIQYKRAKMEGKPVPAELQEQYNATLPAGGDPAGGTFDKGQQRLNDLMERVAGYIARVETLFGRISQGIHDSLEPFTSGEFAAVWGYVKEQFGEGVEKLGKSWENLGNGISSITPLLQVVAQIVGTILVKALEGLLVVGSWVFNGLATLVKWVTDLINIFAEAVRICANELAYLIDIAKQALQYLGLVNTASSGLNNLAMRNMVDGWLGNKSVTVNNNISQSNTFPPLKESVIPKYAREAMPKVPAFPNIGYGGAR